jgi:DNA mismatch repair ATPase MutS
MKMAVMLRHCTPRSLLIIDECARALPLFPTL